MIKVIEAKLKFITRNDMNACQRDMKSTSLQSSTSNIEDSAMLYQATD
jgi:hypothetical protein